MSKLAMIPFSVNMRIQVCKNRLKQLCFFIHQVLAKDTSWVFIIISDFYRLHLSQIRHQTLGNLGIVGFIYNVRQIRVHNVWLGNKK